MHKNILIVGGTDGIGRAVAQQMAALHYSVTIVGRSSQKGTAVLTWLNQRYPEGQHHFIAADLSEMSNVVQVVKDIQKLAIPYDTVLHTADVLKVAREETPEGLEVSIATNFYARVLMNDLLVWKNEDSPTKHIIHVAAAGFPPGKNFMKKFPVASTASSFTGHGVGQIANDFYGYYAANYLCSRSVQVNILNPGMVDTDIRRNGSFPKWARGLLSLMDVLLTRMTTAPEEYAKIVVDIITGANPVAQHSVLINAKGKTKSPSRHLLERETQQYVVDTARQEIDRLLKVKRVAG